LYYIPATPRIKIEKTSVSIPSDVRPGFYRLFDRVRNEFINESIPAQLASASQLSKAYGDVENRVLNAAGLQKITFHPSLKNFLIDPYERLVKGPLFDLLFDLIKEKMTLDDFSSNASRELLNLYKELYRRGYEKWVALSLIALAEPGKAYAVDIPVCDTSFGAPTGRREPSPRPQPISQLDLDHKTDSGYLSYMVPELIVYSNRLQKYIAIRTGTDQPLFTADNPNPRREWLKMGDVRGQAGYALVSPSLLLYADSELDAVSLVADFEKICQPQMVVQCMDQTDWYNSEKLLDNIQRKHNALKPILGSYIISLVAVPDEIRRQFESCPAVEEGTASKQNVVKGAAINIIEAGLDVSRLEPLLQALNPPELPSSALPDFDQAPGIA
jgi:hypothetical protein